MEFAVKKSDAFPLLNHVRSLEIGVHRIGALKIQTMRKIGQLCILAKMKNHWTAKVYLIHLKLKIKITNFIEYIRIRQTRLNTGNDNDFRFSSLEYFGTILEPK